MGTARNGRGRIVALMEESPEGLFVVHYFLGRGAEVWSEYETNNGAARFVEYDLPTVLGYRPLVVWCGESTDMACGYDPCPTCAARWQFLPISDAPTTTTEKGTES
jgi:hypothetical protein